MANNEISSYDFYLEASGVKKGFLLARDEQDVRQYQVGLTPLLAPQQRFSANNLYEGQPPEVTLVTAAETWVNGAGYEDYKTDTPETDDPHNLTFYNYSRGVDLSEPGQVTLSPKRNVTTDSSGSTIDGAPLQYLTTSLGTFMITENRIYEWDTTDLWWVSRDTSGSYTRGAIEYNGYVFVPRGQSNAYLYSNDGTTWTASTATGTTKYADCFCTRGDDGDATSPTLNVLVRLYANTVSVNTSGVNGGAAWTSADTIGPTNETARWVAPAEDLLFIFKKEGIYSYDFANVDDVWKALYLKDDNATHLYMWGDGKFYTNYGDRLLQYDPATNDLAFVFPLDVMDSTEVKGSITGISGDDNHLYLTIENDVNGNTYVMKGQPNGPWHTWAFPYGSLSSQGLPDSGTSDSSVGTIAWTNPSNITANNGSYATATAGTSEYLLGTNFGFAVPTEATIEGVQLDIARKSQQGASPGKETPVYQGSSIATKTTGLSLSITNPVPNTADILHVLTVVTPVGATAMPVGWSTIASTTDTSLGTTKMATFYKISTVADGATFSIGFDVSSAATATVVSYNNVDTSDPFDAVTTSNTGTADTAQSIGAVTTAGDNAVLVGSWWPASSGSSNSYTAVGTPLTERQEESNAAVYKPLMTASGVQSSAGSSGTKTATYSTTVVYMGHLMAFNAADQAPAAADTTDSTVTLWVSGAASGDNKASATQWSNTDEVATYGGSGDLWGATLTPAIVNASNFGAAMNQVTTGGTASVDYYSITVYYSIPGSSRGSQTCYVAGPGAILADNPIVLTGYGSDGSTYYILPQANLRPQDDPNYRYETDLGTEGAIVVGPWVDNGAAAYPKFLNRGTTLGTNITAGKPVTLSYAKDNQSAVEILTATDNGLTGTNITDTEISYYRIRYQVQLETTGDTTSPIVYGWTFQSSPNAPRYRVWDIIAVLTNQQALRDRNIDYWQDSAALEDFLFSSVSKRVTYTDPRNNQFIVRLYDVQSLGFTRQKIGGDERLAPTYQLQLIEIAPISPSISPLVYGTDSWNDNHDWS